MNSPSKNIKVMLLCTGAGIFNRGIESFFREAFDGLYGTPGLDVHLVMGGPATRHNEHHLALLRRTSLPARLIGKLVKRSGYTIEQLSALPSAIRWIRKHRPDVILYSDANIMMRLYPLRKRIGVPFRTVLSNGGPLDPPFINVELVQQVAPFYYDTALAAGEDSARHMMVPYGINVPPGDPVYDPARRLALRRELGLPTDRKIVLTVGWIAEQHKRMHHAIREVASISPDPAKRPFLMLLGNIDDSSPPMFALAKELLGEGNYAIRSVPYDQVANYYQTAELFALCSLKEGFGRVYIEALMQGLPTLAHPHPVMKFVVGEQGTLVDMSAPGQLAAAIQKQLATDLDPAAMARRRAEVRERFSWPALAPAYRELFAKASNVPLPSFDN